MIRRAQSSPTGWILAFVGFGATGAAVGLVVAWASGWPSSITAAIGAAIGLLLAWRTVARPSTPLSVATPDTDLSASTTARIRLRRFTQDDARAEAVLATIDEEVTRSMGWSPADVASIAAIASDPDRFRSQGSLALSPAIQGGLRSDASDSDDVNDVLGVVSLTRPPQTPGAAWLGLWLAEPARGHGLAAEAIGLAGQLAWSVGLGSITMGTTGTNLAMQNSFTRAGAVLFDTTPHLLPDGRTVESVWFRLDRPDDPLTSGDR